MDLYAYAQKDKLDKLAKANGIEVERLRGYRLMATEEPWSEEYIKEVRHELESDYWWLARSHDSMEDICRSREEFRDGYRPGRWELPLYFTEGGRLKSESIFHRLSCLRGRWAEQARCWNRYAGKENVLYIHSRVGRGWRDYRNEPWFLDGCLDAFDPTYCDIYAKIEVKE